MLGVALETPIATEQNCSRDTLWQKPTSAVIRLLESCTMDGPRRHCACMRQLHAGKLGSQILLCAEQPLLGLRHASVSGSSHGCHTSGGALRCRRGGEDLRK